MTEEYPPGVEIVTESCRNLSGNHFEKSRSIIRRFSPLLSEIADSVGGEYEDGCILDCCDVKCGRI